MTEQVILAVDDNGKFLEYIPKEAGHTGEGKRHLGVTVLLYNNKGEVLLQRRKHKVFDNIWDFTASTHPLHLSDGSNESLEQATLRALKIEYDINDISLKKIGEFNYFAQTGKLCENEHDHLLTGEYNGEIKLNPDAAYEFKWVDKRELLKDMAENPTNYSAWSLESLKVLKQTDFFLSKNLMLAVLKEKAAPGVSIKQVPIPKPKKDEVLVKVIYSSICGTDIGIYDWIPWAQAHIKPPTIIGHEIVGEVLQVNTNRETNIKVGDLVSSETHIFCLNCYQCQIKNYHICENMQLFGIGRDGAFAEYATIPLRTTWKNDPSIPLEAMSMQEPLGNAVHVVTKAGVKDKKVLVMGLGPVGLCAGAVAKVMGAKEVVGINDEPYRRNIANKMGFDRTLSKLSKKEYGTYDVVMEMSGNRLGINITFEAVRIGGILMAFGIPKENVTIDWGKYMINKELTILSVFGRKIWETWHQTTSILKSRKINIKPLITHEFKLKDFERAMAVMKSRKCGKILLSPEK